MPVTIERLSPAGVAQLGDIRERRLRRGSIRDRGKRIEIGLVNNMPDAALLATERQFSSLLDGRLRARRCARCIFTRCATCRAPTRRAARMARTYQDVSRLRGRRLDALIVTGAEPSAPELSQEPYWRALCRTDRLGRFQHGFDDPFLPGGACRRAASRRNRAPAAARQMFGTVRLRDIGAQQAGFGSGVRRADAAFAPQRIAPWQELIRKGYQALTADRRDRRRHFRQAAAKPVRLPARPSRI